MTLETLFSSVLSFSTCSVFFALLTAMCDPLQFSPALCLRGGLNSARVQGDSRPHAGAEITTFHVLAFCDRRLRLDHAGDQRGRVLDELLGREGNLAHRHMHQRRLVGAK